MSTESTASFWIYLKCDTVKLSFSDRPLIYRHKVHLTVIFLLSLYLTGWSVGGVRSEKEKKERSLIKDLKMPAMGGFLSYSKSLVWAGRFSYSELKMLRLLKL